MSFSSSSVSLLRLHLPFSTPISERKQHKAALALLSSPLLLASPCQAVQQAGNRGAGPVKWASQEVGRNGLGRRDAIGLGVCLNAFTFFFFFQGPSGGRGVEAVAAPAQEGQCSFAVASSGLAFCDRLVGVGAAATRGQLIKAHYVGKLVDGKVFDSSYSRGKPLTFRVGVGEVIKGWDQGILGDEGIPPMLSGGKRTLRIPPELAYGARGAGCRGGLTDFAEGVHTHTSNTHIIRDKKIYEAWRELAFLCPRGQIGEIITVELIEETLEMPEALVSFLQTAPSFLTLSLLARHEMRWSCDCCHPRKVIGGLVCTLSLSEECSEVLEI